MFLNCSKSNNFKNYTIQKYEVYVGWNDLASKFAISLEFENQSSSYFLLLCYFFFSLIFYVDIQLEGENKVVWNESKTTTFQKYDKFWTISQGHFGHFIKHKLLISEKSLNEVSETKHLVSFQTILTTKKSAKFFSIIINVK